MNRLIDPSAALTRSEIACDDVFAALASIGFCTLATAMFAVVLFGSM